MLKRGTLVLPGSRAAKTLLLTGVIALAALGSLRAAPLGNPLWQTAGIAYFRELNPRLPLAVHVVRIDRSAKDLELYTTLGGRSQIGMAVLSEQAQYIDPQIGKAVAAINGDYFFVERPLIGDPMNLQILRGGELVSGPGSERAFFYLDAKGEPHLTNTTSAFTVTWPSGKSTAIALNEMPDSTMAVLYTSAAGPRSPNYGTELILERNGDGPWLPLHIGQTLSAKVRQINKRGYSGISKDTLILSVNPGASELLTGIAPGAVLKFSLATTPDLTGATLAIGGGPTLVRGGKARHANEFAGFQRHDPRSAMGWNSQYFYFVQADGRQPRYSMGMTLEEMADYFVKLGCTDAINLDGGGSCTTWIAGRTVNLPSQRGFERPSGNALVVVRKNKPAP